MLYTVAMHIFTPDFNDTVLRLLAALVFGVVLGTEREFAHKAAGMRTYALVSLGAALFTVIGIITSETYMKYAPVDPLHVIAQVVVGIGFLGAGLFIYRSDHPSGTTTAAGLWLAAGIGMACGFGLYALASLAVLLTLFTFTGLWFIEDRFKETLAAPEVRLGPAQTLRPSAKGGGSLV